MLSAALMHVRMVFPVVETRIGHQLQMAVMAAQLMPAAGPAGACHARWTTPNWHEA